MKKRVIFPVKIKFPNQHAARCENFALAIGHDSAEIGNIAAHGGFRVDNQESGLLGHLASPLLRQPLADHLYIGAMRADYKG